MPATERAPRSTVALRRVRDRLRALAASPHVDRVAALPASPWFAYPALIAVQTRALWGIWHKDMTTGDTLGYLHQAIDWSNSLHDNIVWSPLYTNFYGTLVKVTGNIVTATILHRVIIVFALAVIVLAILRRLLPAPTALLVACWWAVLPITFDSLYEVHLFAALPPLIAVLLLTNEPGPWRRGSAFALLVGSTLLVRNEVLLVAATLAGAFVWSERRSRREGAGIPIRRLALAAGVPLLIALLLMGGAFARSTLKGKAMTGSWHGKHVVNVCQVYATNFQQRHPDRFTANPWTECQVLMQQVFHKRLPTLTEAWQRNPKAMLGFTRWNLHLLPNGIQLGLFDSSSSGDNPDYVPADLRQPWAGALTVLLLQLLAFGGVLLWRDRKHWLSGLCPQRWAWGALGVVSAVTIAVIILLERPRPSYMFALTFSLMAAAGLALSAIVRRYSWHRAVGVVAVAVPLAVVVALPAHYHQGPRPLKDLYDRTRPFVGRLDPGTAVVPAADDVQACLLVAATKRCNTVAFQTVIVPQLATRSLKTQLDAYSADLIYADATVTSDPSFQTLLQKPRALGWRIARSGSDTAGRWAVLVRLSG